MGSMHLEGPGLTTTKYNSKGKKPANTAAQRKAQADHEAWLRKQGIHPDQLESRKKNFKKEAVKPIRDGMGPLPKLSNNLHVKGGFRSTVMDNLHKEKPEVQKEILAKASRLVPLYNKGAIQYASPGEDITKLGSKSKK